MSRYDRDPRVRRGPGNGYQATGDDGHPYQVLPTALGWAIFTGGANNPNMASDAQGNLAYGFADADTALHALLGKPRRGGRR